MMMLLNLGYTLCSASWLGRGEIPQVLTWRHDRESNPGHLRDRQVYVADDARATVKWVRIFLRHPSIQDIVNSEDGRSALILLETVETLLKTEEGTGGY
jgi:hypothetical protein